MRNNKEEDSVNFRMEEIACLDKSVELSDEIVRLPLIKVP